MYFIINLILGLLLIPLSQSINISTDNLTLIVEPVFNKEYLLNLTYIANSTILPTRWSLHKVDVSTGTISNHTLRDVENLAVLNDSIIGNFNLEDGTSFMFEAKFIDRGWGVSSPSVVNPCESRIIVNWTVTVMNSTGLQFLGSRTMVDNFSGFFGLIPQPTFKYDKLYLSGSMSTLDLNAYDNNYDISLIPLGFISNYSQKNISAIMWWYKARAYTCSGNYVTTCDAIEYDSLKESITNCETSSTTIQPSSTSTSTSETQNQSIAELNVSSDSDNDIDNSSSDSENYSNVKIVMIVLAIVFTIFGIIAMILYCKQARNNQNLQRDIEAKQLVLEHEDLNNPDGIDNVEHIKIGETDSSEDRKFEDLNTNTESKSETITDSESNY